MGVRREDPCWTLEKLGKMAHLHHRETQKQVAGGVSVPCPKEIVRTSGRRSPYHTIVGDTLPCIAGELNLLNRYCRSDHLKADVGNWAR